MGDGHLVSLGVVFYAAVRSAFAVGAREGALGGGRAFARVEIGGRRPANDCVPEVFFAQMAEFGIGVALAAQLELHAAEVLLMQ